MEKKKKAKEAKRSQKKPPTADALKCLIFVLADRSG